MKDDVKEAPKVGKESSIKEKYETKKAEQEKVKNVEQEELTRN